MTVDMVKIHHEGGGAPNDVPKDGYSIWIGKTGFQLVRPPWEDWSTLNLNHVVMGVCFSGMRQTNLNPFSRAYRVTDQEITWVQQAVQTARNRGWVTATPQVSPHDNLAGSATQCPGNLVYARWNDVVTACMQIYVPVPAPEDDDMESYPYPHPADPNKFSGAIIDRGNNRVTLYGNAKINQTTLGPYWGTGNPNPILTSYKEVNGFAVVTSDSDVYHLQWV